MLRRGGGWLVAIALAGCGRLGYDYLSAGADGGGDGGAGTDADVPVGLCATPRRLASPSGVAHVASIGDELAVFTADANDVQRPLAYHRFTGVGDAIGGELALGSSNCVNIEVGAAVGPDEHLMVTCVSGAGDRSDIDLRAVLSDGSGSGTPVPLTADTDTSDMPAVTALGAQVGVAWRRNESTGQNASSIEFRIFDADGAPVTAVESFAPPSQRDFVRPRLAFGGTNIALVWSETNATVGTDDDRVLYVAIDPDTGTRTSEPIELAASDGSSPDIVPVVGGFAVVWPFQVALIDTSGTVLKSVATELNTPRVAADDSGLIVGGLGPPAVSATLQRYDLALDPIGEPIVAAEGVGLLPGLVRAVAPGPNGWAIVYTRSLDAPTGMYFSVVCP